jgi:hypothetical protein
VDVESTLDEANNFFQTGDSQASWRGARSAGGPGQGPDRGKIDSLSESVHEQKDVVSHRDRYKLKKDITYLQHLLHSSVYVTLTPPYRIIQPQDEKRIGIASALSHSMSAKANGSLVALPFNDTLGETIPPDTPHVGSSISL